MVEAVDGVLVTPMIAASLEQLLQLAPVATEVAEQSLFRRGGLGFIFGVGGLSLWCGGRRRFRCGLDLLRWLREKVPVQVGGFGVLALLLERPDPLDTAVRKAHFVLDPRRL